MQVRKLGLVALACLGVLGLGAASAQAASFTAESYPAAIEGRQGGEEGSPASGIPQVPFGTGGGAGGPAGSVFGFEGKLMTSCYNARFTGELSAPSTSLTVSPTFKECAAFGFLGATVTPNGCQYVFGVGEEEGEGIYAGSFGVTCPEGKKIVIVQGNCEVQIGPQSGKAGISLMNLEEGPEIPAPAIAVGLTVSEIAYTKTKDGAFCSLVGTGAMSDGVLEGGFYMRARNGKAEPIGLGIE